MGFSVQKAVVYGVAMFAGLLAGILLGGGVPLGIALGGASLGAVLSGLLAGYLMREAELEVAAATPASVEAAVRGAWALRSFKRSVAEDGVVTYVRGAGIFADRMSVSPTATGVLLHGPSNVLAVVKRKAAG